MTLGVDADTQTRNHLIQMIIRYRLNNINIVLLIFWKEFNTNLNKRALYVEIKLREPYLRERRIDPVYLRAGTVKKVLYGINCYRIVS